MSESSISGWILDLEARVVSLEGNILALPTRSDIAQFTNMISGRLNTIDAAQVTQNNNITALIQNFANIKNTIVNIDANLSWHTGLSTGVGVHGHGNSPNS